MSPKKKRQHYLPRFILRNFSEDGRRISLVILKSGRRIDGASLKEQAYRDYFYGDDEVIENSFADSEARIAPLLEVGHPERFEQVNDEDFYQLRLFLHYQRFRTQRAANEVLAAQTAMARDLIQSWAEINKIEGVEPNDFRVAHDGPQYLALEQAAESTPMLIDLDVKMLTRDRPPWFVISDHPVVMYNQFVEHHSQLGHLKGIGGLATRGLQIFMPVSPSTCLFMYDPGAYRCGSKDKRTCHISKPDAERINILQTLNAEACIYFDARLLDAATIETLLAGRKRFADQQAHNVQSGPLYPKPDGTQGQMMVYRPPHFAVGGKFSFATVQDKTNYSGYPHPFPPARSPRLLELTKRYRRELEKRRAQESATNAPSTATGTSGEEADS
jgi:hypothetical protein